MGDAFMKSEWPYCKRSTHLTVLMAAPAQHRCLVRTLQALLRFLQQLTASSTNP